jgi:hypothetical protein
MVMCAAGGYVLGNSSGACCPYDPTSCGFVRASRGGLFCVITLGVLLVRWTYAAAAKHEEDSRFVWSILVVGLASSKTSSRLVKGLLVGTINSVESAHERLALVPPHTRDHLVERLEKCQKRRLGRSVHPRVGIQPTRHRWSERVCWWQGCESIIPGHHRSTQCKYNEALWVRVCLCSGRPCGGRACNRRP